MSIPSNPSNGDIISFGGSQYVYDSAKNRWIIIKSIDVIALENKHDSDLSNIRFNDLADVNVSYPPDHNTILSWDSDLNNWNARQFTHDPLGAIGLKHDIFIASYGQTEFRLSHYPIGDIEFKRNGISLSPTSNSVVGKIVTYNFEYNDSDVIDANDVIIISYNYGTSIALTAELADLTDVDVTSSLPKQGEVLAWDSDNGVFAPSTDLKDDIAQAVSDRVYADSVLSGRIDTLETSVDSQTGNFYVQSTAPTGSANSGWVNTTNMKLYVWDVNSEVWTQVTLT